MRRDRLRINSAVGLKEIKEDLRQMLREQRTLALKHLDDIADQIYIEAFSKVPVRQEIAGAHHVGTTLYEEPGTLQDSIQVDISRSPRYPGIIATAEAHNPNTDFDYAVMQEVVESYEHTVGQAHYLEEPFRNGVAEFYRRMGWK